MIRPLSSRPPLCQPHRRAPLHQINRYRLYPFPFHSHQPAQVQLMWLIKHRPHPMARVRVLDRFFCVKGDRKLEKRPRHPLQVPSRPDCSRRSYRQHHPFVSGNFSSPRFWNAIKRNRVNSLIVSLNSYDFFYLFYSFGFSSCSY